MDWKTLQALFGLLRSLCGVVLMFQATHVEIKYHDYAHAGFLAILACIMWQPNSGGKK